MNRRSLLIAALGAAIVPSSAFALTQSQTASGLRQALSAAAQYATDRLGQRDGFFGDNRVRIALPRTLANAQRSLAPLHMSGPLDDLQLRMNRGAEAAMPQAKRLFLSAIRTITIQDAIGIVTGGDDAATRYLRGRTEGDLTTALRPPMRNALDGAGAFTALDRASRSLQSTGLVPSSTELRSQVVNFAVTKALDGAFLYLGEEEGRIRHNPVKQTTSLLRQIFGH
ncbi:MAG: DUF4197 domain-containing protein [Pseudomonadota bacterium]